MSKFYYKIVLYLLCYVLVMLGLNAFDYNRFIKQNRVVEARILYLIISFVLTYLLGSFLMDIIYFFN